MEMAVFSDSIEERSQQKRKSQKKGLLEWHRELLPVG